MAKVQGSAVEQELIGRLRSILMAHSVQESATFVKLLLDEEKARLAGRHEIQTKNVLYLHQISQKLTSSAACFENLTPGTAAYVIDLAARELGIPGAKNSKNLQTRKIEPERELIALARAAKRAAEELRTELGGLVEEPEPRGGGRPADLDAAAVASVARRLWRDNGHGQPPWNIAYDRPLPPFGRFLKELIDACGLSRHPDAALKRLRALDPLA